MTGLDPDISIGMVADWDCIVRNLVRVTDGRVKPGHDGGIFGAWYKKVYSTTDTH
jgi:hypothetical protein